MKSNDVSMIAAPLPDFLNEKLDFYDKTRVRSYGYLHLLDKRDLYTQAILTLRQPDLKKDVKWLLWTKLPFDSFLQMEKDSSLNISTVSARLYSDVFSYTSTKDIEVVLEFEMAQEVVLPTVKILDNHPELFRDFSYGIDKERFLTLQRELGGKSFD